MVHAHERLVVRERERLGALTTNAKADLEARPDGDGDCVHVRDRGQTGAFDSLAHHAVERRRVRVARHIGFDATPLLMQRRLRRERLAENAAVARDDGDARVIAARLDAEYRKWSPHGRPARADTQEMLVGRAGKAALHALSESDVGARRGGAGAAGG